MCTDSRHLSACPCTLFCQTVMRCYDDVSNLRVINIQSIVTRESNLFLFHSCENAFIHPSIGGQWPDDIMTTALACLSIRPQNNYSWRSDKQRAQDTFWQIACVMKALRRVECRCRLIPSARNVSDTITRNFFLTCRRRVCTYGTLLTMAVGPLPCSADVGFYWRRRCF